MGCGEICNIFSILGGIRLFWFVLLNYMNYIAILILP